MTKIFRLLWGNCITLLCTAVIAALVLYRHKSNIENLLQGKEGKIGDKAEN